MRDHSARARQFAPLGVAAATGLGCAAVWLADPTTPGGAIPVCPTKAVLGLVCPGCGSMRMIYSLLHGDLAAAMHFNALGLIAVPLLLIAYMIWAWGRLRRRRIQSWQHHRWAAMTVLVAVSIWFVVRNLPWAPFAALRV